MRIKSILCALPIVAAFGLAACGPAEEGPPPGIAAQERIEKKADERAPYEPKNDVEFKNYNRAQKTYDDSSTIIWCTTTWGNPSAPIVTIPVAGKLTSSSVSFYSGTHWVDRGDYSWSEVESKSVDGMYHGSPPPYRYGFTPGGQYVDFFNMPTMCTTALTKITRQTTKVALELDSQLQQAQATAEEALKRGDEKAAQNALENALDG